MQQVGNTIVTKFLNQVHYGRVGDPLPPKYHAYGVTDKTSFHVQDCVKDSTSAGFSRKLNDFKEEIYKSNKAEPLGQTIDRGYNWPAQTKNPTFEFGVKTLESKIKII